MRSVLGEQPGKRGFTCAFHRHAGESVPKNTRAHPLNPPTSGKASVTRMRSTIKLDGKRLSSENPNSSPEGFAGSVVTTIGIIPHSKVFRESQRALYTDPAERWEFKGDEQYPHLPSSRLV